MSNRQRPQLEKADLQLSKSVIIEESMVSYSELEGETPNKRVEACKKNENFEQENKVEYELHQEEQTSRILDDLRDPQKIDHS